MVWYVAVVAILNLALGYVLALYMGVGQRQLITVGEDVDDDSQYDVYADA